MIFAFLRNWAKVDPSSLAEWPFDRHCEGRANWPRVGPFTPQGWRYPRPATEDQDVEKRAAIYARVSTLVGQNPAMQLDVLREFAEKRGSRS